MLTSCGLCYLWTVYNRQRSFTQVFIPCSLAPKTKPGAQTLSFANFLNVLKKKKIAQKPLTKALYIRLISQDFNFASWMLPVWVQILFSKWSGRTVSPSPWWSVMLMPSPAGKTGLHLRLCHKRRRWHCTKPCHTSGVLKTTFHWKEWFCLPLLNKLFTELARYWTVWCSWCYLACIFVWGLLLLLYFFQINRRNVARCKDIHALTRLQCSQKQLDTQDPLKESEKLFSTSFRLH